MLQQLKSFKEIIGFIFALVYAVFLPLIRWYPNRVVIFYHSVKKEYMSQFEKQMAYLASKCKVVEPSRVRETPAKGQETLVAITFDDAFVSIFENAIPIMKKHGFTAGISVPTGNLGQAPRWEILDNCADKNETVMSQEQIAELSSDGFEIFSHTVSHPLLTEIGEDRLRSELVDSKEKLERIIGREVVGVSYPHGAHDERVCNAAKRAGYKLGFTIEPQMVDGSVDNMKIGRFEVSPANSVLMFRLKVNGAYRTVKYLQGLKRRLQ